MQIKKNALVALAIAGMASAASSFAQSTVQPDTGLYIGVGVGQVKAKDACTGIVVGTCDDKDTSYNAFVGYDFNRTFAAELGYVNFGEMTAATTVGVTRVAARWEATAFELVGVAKWPLTQALSLYGKLGAYRWDVDATATAGAATASASETGTDLTYGVGVRYGFTPKLSGQVEWRRYADAGKDTTTGQADLDVIGVSVLFKF